MGDLTMEEKALLKQVIDNPRTFETIKNPSEEVIIAALSRNGNNIKFIMNPTFEQKKILAAPFCLLHAAAHTPFALIPGSFSIMLVLQDLIYQKSY